MHQPSADMSNQLHKRGFGKMRKRKEKQHQLLGAEKGKIASAKVKRPDKLALD